jgi:hypothetical protein
MEGIMKKVITIVMILIIIMLSSCGGGKPSDLSDEAYEQAVDIVRVADYYDNGTYDSANASSLINIKYDEFSNIDDSSNTYLNLSIEIPLLRDYIKNKNQAAFKSQLEQIKDKLGIK